jgi:hypothetical protein
MVSESARRAARDRGDLSKYMVHLTRDDRKDFPGGQSAVENFTSILDDLEIRAYSAHCLHGKQVKALGDKVEELFQVSCFTETPLNELKNLLDVGWRKIFLEPYGFVFDRDFLLLNGAQHVTYVNNYAGHDERRAAYDQIFKIAARRRFKGTIWKVLPFVNVMHGGHDFAWEREWRVRGNVSFELSDLVCVVLPEDEQELRERLEYMGVAAIAPEWRYEQMVGELAQQQRQTRKVWKDKYVKQAAGKPPMKLVKVS